jgi:hypothetical protein
LTPGCSKEEKEQPNVFHSSPRRRPRTHHEIPGHRLSAQFASMLPDRLQEANSGLIADIKAQPADPRESRTE